MKFKVFRSFDEVKTNTESSVEVIVKGEGEDRLLCFDKPVRVVEIKKLEALKIAFALLGRVGICENCGTPFRRKASTGLYAKARFCSRNCYYEWCRKTGGTFGRHQLVETSEGFQLILKEEVKQTITREQHVKWGRQGGKRTQKIHPHVRLNLKQYAKKLTINGS